MYNHFPKPWKHAILTMIPKPGKDQKFPLNFRPISLISSIGKIYEKILLKELKNTPWTIASSQTSNTDSGKKPPHAINSSEQLT
ncbi:hypothetical protein TNCV_3846801 [Trichonephila clavipes]|nr:hypothetical protein TNCV_50711 [Trichonephila clavipes]GFW24946.1 hypothetical protein TNCV_3846801 [Trichonephila clavipes]